ncbi:OmpA family protein [Hymenobacter sp. BT730]|uniref:OmpA family protein n=1 Tax=Hymenobacter sp. BT730 TaxID=3063332 RepID=UPI0026DF437B|nr:OmpA family protein [Hymenobacter sp. BT730]
MSQNLLELVEGYFSSDTVHQTSTALGESESSVGTALRSVIPLALAALFGRAQQPGGTAEVYGMARQAHSTGILGNLGDLLGGMTRGSTMTADADGGLLNRGAELLRSVLGSSYTPAIEQIGQQAGVKSSSIHSLLSMAVPVGLGLMGRHAAQNNLDEVGFGTYINSQRNSLSGALSRLPGGLGNMLAGLGLGAAGAAASVGNAAAGAARNVGSTMSAAARNPSDTNRGAASVPERTATPARWPWLLLALLALAALWYFMRGCNREPDTTDTTTTEAPMDTTSRMAPAAPATAPTGRYDKATGNYIYDTGSTTEIKLSDGTVLNVGSNSTEARLFNFLNDATMTVSDDKTQGWFSLDRVYFNTGKSTLTAESQAQLKNIAAILKAFPNAAIKFGGYTDNVGKADMNLTLSADRANAARKALMNSGIDAGRVAAEGYGQEHPIASNDTPEGRAQNRRVDVRVTKK